MNFLRRIFSNRKNPSDTSDSNSGPTNHSTMMCVELSGFEETDLANLKSLLDDDPGLYLDRATSSLKLVIPVNVFVVGSGTFADWLTKQPTRSTIRSRSICVTLGNTILDKTLVDSLICREDVGATRTAVTMFLLQAGDEFERE